jgi:NitT/TauT family transport system permease protein
MSSTDLEPDLDSDPISSPDRPAFLMESARAIRVWFPAVIVLVVLFVGWQLYAVGHVHVVPPLQDIWAQLTGQPGLYWRNMLTTLRESLVGGAIGMSIAFILGVLMTHMKLFVRAIMPLAIVLNVTPMIAVAPGLVVAFGFGYTPKYIVTAVVVFFPFLINSLVGLRSIDPLTHEVMRTLNASKFEVLVKLRLPSSLPFLFAAARICLPLSVIGAVAAEFVAAGQARGLGTLIVIAATVSDLPTIYAAVFTLSVMGVVLSGIVMIAERRLLSWHESSSWIK